MVPNQARQGDVLLHPLKALPSHAKPLKAAGKKLVLAEGEATGHSHTIERSEKFTAYEDWNGTYLDVHEPVEVQHQEHATLVLQPGVYHVRRQMEFWLNEARRVAD